MEIRLANETDIPAIIDLLKLGLGESRVRKSEEYWNWKHIQNPFGASFVLLAISNGSLVAVRTFMCWRWRHGKEMVDAVRGVDTVVHPDYQGRGLFGEMSFQLADYCRNLGYKFLFSTPNMRSRKAYENIGWREYAQLPVKVKVENPVRLVLNLFSAVSSDSLPPEDGSVIHYLGNETARELIDLNAKLYASKVLTAHTVESLRWRYSKVPVTRYFAEGIEQEGRLKALYFYRIKQSRGGRELRVTDVFVDRHERTPDLRRLVHKKMKEHNVDFASSGCFIGKNMLAGGLSIQLNGVGPTIKMVDLDLADVYDYVTFSKWHPSFGDLELF